MGKHQGRDEYSMLSAIHHQDLKSSRCTVSIPMVFMYHALHKMSAYSTD